VSPYDQPPLSAHAFGVSIGRECRRDHRGVRKRGSPRTYGADYLGRPTRLVDVASASGSWPWVPPASVGAAVDGSQVGERVVRLEAAGSEPGDGCQGPLRRSVRGARRGVRVSVRGPRRARGRCVRSVRGARRGVRVSVRGPRRARGRCVRVPIPTPRVAISCALPQPVPVPCLPEKGSINNRTFVRGAVALALSLGSSVPLKSRLLLRLPFGVPAPWLVSSRPSKEVPVRSLPTAADRRERVAPLRMRA
jgi:hypothetical protein